MIRRIKNYIIRLKVEKALGFKLYKWQRDYVFRNSHYIPNIRACGKTLAFQLKFLLATKQPPVNIDAIRHNFEWYTDIFTTSYEVPTKKYVEWYTEQLIHLYKNLKSHNIKTRKIIF